MGFLKKIFGGGGNNNSNNNANGGGGNGNRKNKRSSSSSSNNNNANGSSGGGGGNVNSSLSSSFASDDVLAGASPYTNRRGGYQSPPSQQQQKDMLLMSSPRGGLLGSANSRTSSTTTTSFDGPGIKRSSRPASINAVDLDEDEDDVLAATTNFVNRGFHSSLSNSTTPRMSQEELRAAYESSQRALKASGIGAGGRNGAGRSSFNNSSSNNNNQYGNGMSPNNNGNINNGRLTPEQLQQWDKNNNNMMMMGAGGMSSSRPVYTMSSEFPRQQMEAMDDMNRSDASSSSFNLSTDAEDSEYETLRRRGVYPMPGSGMLDTSNALDTGSLSYTTDEERSKIFPNLPTDDEMTQSTEPSLTYYPQPPPSLLGLEPDELADSSDFPHSMNVLSPVAATTATGESLRAWSVHNPPMMSAAANSKSPAKIAISTVASPTSSSSSPPHEPPSTTRSSTSRDHHFFGGPDSSSGGGGSPTSNKSPSKMLTMSNPTATAPGVGAVPASAGPGTRKAAPTSSNTNTGSTTVSRNIPGRAPREFTTPMEFISSPTSSSSQRFRNGTGNMESTSGKNNNNNNDSGPDLSGFGNDDFQAVFGNFADFADFPSTNDSDWNEEKKEQRWEDMKDSSVPDSFSKQTNGWNKPTLNDLPNQHSTLVGGASPFDGPPFENTIVATSYASASGSSSGFQQDRSLSDLLEAAKSKSHRRSGSRGNRISSSRASGGSVNSAPAITAAYLRQHHNLGRYSSGTYKSGSGELTNDHGKSIAEGTSVSDIIQSLEAMKQPTNGPRVYSHRSVGETGAITEVRLAKERLRERRRRSRDTGHGISNSRSAGSDSDDSDHEASESWLFDEVTGALGPRGIAADLESLSGRSNRSKNSHGGVSHKSSRRKSSRKSGSRRQRSDRSVDSHGSRTSRNSRYSHRSTKSHLSHMSEQSRSVANDLLRLEMQLAMVGSSSEEKKDDIPGRIGSGSVSLGVSSRSTTRRSASMRAPSSSSAAFLNASASSLIQRQRTKIIAPPGKLGIILANKSDSKGTVVSGVRETSVLFDKISQGDRIVAIDGEDVSRMTVSEITTIMSRKSEYERVLTVLTIPKTQENTGSGTPGSAAGNDSGSFTVRSPSNNQKSADRAFRK